jgi:hypothetical protein
MNVTQYYTKYLRPNKTLKYEISLKILNIFRNKILGVTEIFIHTRKKITVSFRT